MAERLVRGGFISDVKDLANNPASCRQNGTRSISADSSASPGRQTHEHSKYRTERQQLSPLLHESHSKHHRPPCNNDCREPHSGAELAEKHVGRQLAEDVGDEEDAERPARSVQPWKSTRRRGAHSEMRE